MYVLLSSGCTVRKAGGVNMIQRELSRGSRLPAEDVRKQKRKRTSKRWGVFSIFLIKSMRAADVFL